MAGQISEMLSFEEYERQIEARLERRQTEARAALARRLPSDALLWAALAPDWTIPLATAAGFPIGDLTLEQIDATAVAPYDAAAFEEAIDPDREQELCTHYPLVAEIMRRMQQASLVDVYQAMPNEDERPMPALYTMRETARADVLRDYSDSADGLAQLRCALATIGRRITEESANLIVVMPVQVRRWAVLAKEAEDTDRMEQTFNAAVNEAFDTQDLAEVLNWMEAARPLVNLLTLDLDRTLELALQRTSRRVELLYRRKVDRQHLQAFLKRDEQIAAYSDLMADTGEHWALHLWGEAGMGKTMLIRHITTELAERDGLATARIDFDYLNADYPRRAPGLLLWALAQELRVHSDDELNRHFDLADDALTKLNKELRASSLPAGKRPTQHELFYTALKRYIDALRAFPKRVLLIVDTCEELAKVRTGSGMADNVEETFRIMRALHDGPDVLLNDSAPPNPREGLPDLRVIFAGRRLLAGSGYNWCDHASRLPPRPYLRLFELHGFESGEPPAYHGEARTYLEQEEVPPALIIPIIKCTCSKETVSGIEYLGHAYKPAPVLRCNPYDLRLYVGWAKSSPPPDPETIERNSPVTQYVALRIMQRLRAPLIESLLPTIALLGHVDLKIIQAIAGVSSEVSTEVYQQLRQQEWINARQASVGQAHAPYEMLDLEPRMQRRLLDYYDQNPSGFGNAYERVATVLMRRTFTDDLGTLDWSFFDAALRVLEKVHPAQAAAWWQKIETRILAERDAEWTLQVTSMLLSEDGAAARGDKPSGAERESRLRPAVLASYAVALLHNPARSMLYDVWSEAAQKYERHPDQQVQATLRLRALAGKVATPRYLGASPAPEDVAALWQQIAGLDPVSLDLQLAAALIAAAEAFVEAAEVLMETSPETARQFLAITPGDTSPGSDLPYGGPGRLAELLEASASTWQAQLPEQQSQVDALIAYASTLAARELLLSGADISARAWFSRALNLSAQLSSSDGPPMWADWLPPDDLMARIRLEVVRAIAVVAVSSVPSGNAAATRTIDSERLLSALLRLHLCHAPVLEEALAPLGWVDTRNGALLIKETDLVPGIATCQAHYRTPPLFVTVAEAVAARGHIDLALRQLQLVSNQVTRFPLDIVRQADRALLRIIRRMRLRDEGERVGSSLLSPLVLDLDDLELIWSLDGLDGPKNVNPIPALPQELSGVVPQQAVLHAIWRILYARDPISAAQVLAWARQHLATAMSATSLDTHHTFPQASLFLDVLEARLLAGPGRDVADLPDVQPLDVHAWWLTHPHQPEAALRLLLRAGALQPPDPTAIVVPDDLIGRIGRRRSAEIALDEGELLALRLPERAVPLLKLAWDSFERCGDMVAATVCGGVIAILHARQAAADNLAEALERLRRSYTSIQQRSIPTPPVVQQGQSQSGPATLANLPTWERLEQLAAEPNEEGLHALTPTGWRPWLVRLMACLNRLGQLRAPESAAGAGAILAWVRRHYGLMIQDIVELPADFDGWLNVPTVPTDLTFTRQADSPALPVSGDGTDELPDIAPPRRAKLAELSQLIIRYFSQAELDDLIRDLGLVLAIPLGMTKTASVAILIITIAKSGLFQSFIQAIARLRPDLVWEVETASEKGALGMESALTRSAVESASSLVLRIFPTELVKPGPVSVVESQSVRISMTLHAKEGERSNLGTIADSIMMPSLAPYTQLPAVLPPRMLTTLQHLAHVRSGRPMEVIIEPEEGLHGPCWEALISMAPPQALSVPPSDLPFRCSRRLAETRSPHSLAATEAPIVVSWAVTRLAHTMAVRGWRPLHAEPRFRIEILRPVKLQELSPTPERVRILHLIGTADEGDAGVYFRVSGETRARELPDIKAEESDQPVRLVHAQEISRTFPTLAVCIVQGPPLSQASRRLESDRRDAMLARAFAADLFAQGIPVVLVLPPLTPPVAVPVLEQMVQAIQERVLPGTDRFLQVIGNMQTLIVEREALSPPVAWELALDVCMYAHKNWNL